VQESSSNKKLSLALLVILSLAQSLQPLAVGVVLARWRVPLPTVIAATQTTTVRGNHNLVTVTVAKAAQGITSKPNRQRSIPHFRTTPLRQHQQRT